MKFKYVGDHDSVDAYGYTFPQGEEVDVDASIVLYGTATLGDKLRGNPEFKEVRTKKVKDENA